MLLKRMSSCLAILLAMAFGLSLSPSEAHATASLRYLSFQFNACDQASHCPRRNDHDARANAIAQSFISNGTSFMTLNEMCTSTFATLKSSLSASGVVFEAYFTRTTTAAACPGSGGFGNAIVVRGNDSILLQMVYLLPGTGEPRKLTCVYTSRFAVAGAPNICGVHISGTDMTTEQIERASDIVYDEAEFAPILFMGDFNRVPESADMWPTRPFFDLDAPTTYGSTPFNEETLDISLAPDKKVDYSFATLQQSFPLGWTDVHADATGSNFSDHDPLVGDALLTFATDSPAP